MKDAGEQTLIMENPERPLDKQLPPEKELMHFKAVVRSIMMDASKVLGYIELEAHGAEYRRTNIPAGPLPGLHTKIVRKRHAWGR